MKDLAIIFCRGWLIVTCVAWNVRNVAALDYPMALMTGTLLSLIWWGNSRTAALSTVVGARWVYALGAGLGTLTGMWLGR